MNSNNKLLFIYLNTGGGHLAPAKALAKYYQNHKYDVEVTLIDGLENSSSFARRIIEDGYRILQSKSKWIYEYLYALNKVKFVAHITAFWVAFFMKRNLQNVIMKENPDHVVIFHFFCIKPVYSIIKKHKLNITVNTVVTDPYIAHPLWILNKNQNFILFSKILRERFVSAGIHDNSIKVFPFILDEKFSTPAKGKKIKYYKKKFGFNKEKILLILGGGDGIPGGLKILRKLLKVSENFDIAIVCGKNKYLFDEITELKKQKKHGNLYVFGFIDFVYELISVSDLVVSKCGASTFMEILISNKIPIVNKYLWEQEKGNVDFIIDNKLGIYEPRVKKMRKKIIKLLNDQSLMNSYLENINKMSLKNGLPEVADYLISE